MRRDAGPSSALRALRALIAAAVPASQFQQTTNLQKEWCTNAQIRGWVEIAKLLGYYAPEVKKLNLSVSGQVLMSKYEGTSDEELLGVIWAEEKGALVVQDV
jgi:hypothetical protein